MGRGLRCITMVQIERHSLFYRRFLGGAIGDLS